jgi:hypothetical protein
MMSSYRPVIMGTRHAVAAGHYLAAEAGFDVLNNGGNAIDAGVAAGLAIGVLQSDIVNVAGVAPIILWIAEEQKVINIDGLGLAACPMITFNATMMAQFPKASSALCYPPRPQRGCGRLNAAGRCRSVMLPNMPSSSPGTGSRCIRCCGRISLSTTTSTGAGHLARRYI